MNRRRHTSRLRLPRFLTTIPALVRRGAARLRLPRLTRGNRRKFGTAPAPVVDRDGEVMAPPRPRTGRLGVVVGWLAPILVAAVAFAVPTFGVKAVNYVRQSHHFQVKEIVIEGQRRLDNATILSLTGIEAGMSVLEADLDALAAPLRTHPWVRWARADRRLPDTLVLEVIEREASAYLAAGELWLVDETGEVFAEADPAEPLELPVISGLTREDLARAGADAAARAGLQIELQGALNLARTWELSTLSRRWPLGEIRIDRTRGHVVVAGGQGASEPVEIVLGREPFRQKLQRLEFTLEALKTNGRTPEYVLLDVADDALATQAGLTAGGPRVIVKADFSDEEAGAEAGPAAAAPFVGPPAPAGGAPEEDTPTHEATPISGGRPADISAGMEE